MIATVTLNPALDVTITVDELVPGESHRTPAARRRAGGKGVNVARVLVRQGVAATVLACVGGAIGEEFARELVAAQLPNRLIWTSAPTRVSRTVHETVAGRATVLNEEGGDPGTSALTALGHLVDTLPALECLVVSGSLPPDMSPSVVADLVTRARRRGAATVVDASGDALMAAAEAGASLLKPNAAELRASVPAVGPVSAAHALLARGAASVVVTRGADGMLAIDASGVRRARLDRELHGNPTGAGDAATAALAAGLAESRSLDDLDLARAVAWSGGAVLAPLAGDVDPSWPDLLARVAIDDIAWNPETEETAWPW